jgi:asparagine synthase (glutamine-hydrolysing)
MCGLCVVAGIDVPPAAFAAALDTMRHRGPDDTQVEYGDRWAVGFQRLAVVDVDHSRQPIHYGGRWTVVFNGEIYNHRQLRQELITTYGASFATEGDGEVLAAAWHHWGPNALPRLRGMFAFAALDAETGAVYAARDGFGIKPLYYLHSAGVLALASEKKALLGLATPADPQTLDREALAHYVTFQFVPEPATLHREIRRLQPGHLLTFAAGGLKLER